MGELDFDADKYRQGSRHQQEWGQALVDCLPLRGSEHILDLGCGDGRLTARLAARVPGGRVLGIDSSESMIASARHLTACNLSFRRMDINDLDFDGRFDVVFSNAALHWVKDHRRLLANVRRALAAGGYLRFGFAGKGNCPAFNQVVTEVMGQPRFAPRFAGFDWPWFMPGVAEYRGLMQSAGFSEASVWSRKADRYFADEEELIRWLDQPSLVPFLAVLDQADREGFRHEVIDRMIQRTLQEDGTCFEQFRRLNVRARKQS